MTVVKLMLLAILFCLFEVNAYTLSFISKKWKGMMLLSRETRMGFRFVTNENKILMKIVSVVKSMLYIALFISSNCLYIEVY